MPPPDRLLCPLATSLALSPTFANCVTNTHLFWNSLAFALTTIPKIFILIRFPVSQSRPNLVIALPSLEEPFYFLYLDLCSPPNWSVNSGIAGIDLEDNGTYDTLLLIKTTVTYVLKCENQNTVIELQPLVSLFLLTNLAISGHLANSKLTDAARSLPLHTALAPLIPRQKIN